MRSAILESHLAQIEETIEDLRGVQRTLGAVLAAAAENRVHGERGVFCGPVESFDTPASGTL
ncbi:MAG TPA: hypothetical protein VGR21_09410 [Cryptosporangiaceae bacterium]|nr:hypothetical protein [Cryptosporangiaceae bacterium]